MKVILGLAVLVIALGGFGRSFWNAPSRLKHGENRTSMSGVGYTPVFEEDEGGQKRTPDSRKASQMPRAT